MPTNFRPAARDLVIPLVGEAIHPSPLAPAVTGGAGAAHFVPVDAWVALDVERVPSGEAPLLLEKAGPRRRLAFDPARVRAAIVTCGGLCPGINNVVRAIVLELHQRYGVPSIVGFRHGFEGMDPASGLDPRPLGPDEVRSIHEQGGTVLGTSRGRHDVTALVDTLVALEVDALFAIGGDGTMRGALAIHDEVGRRGARIAVVAVPKTIDDDIPYVDKSFGFDTAVARAKDAIDAAHVEATGARYGVGLVKLMGRDAGFIAAAATLASDDVNVCLVPEVPFALDGEGGLLAALERRLRARGHAVIVVAEGCGASLVGRDAPLDASGNVRYAADAVDVGPHLRDAIARYFAHRLPITLKYIDPSYMIRSVRPSASDAILCDALGRHAVHAAMAGKTATLVGRVHGVFTHVPLAVATRSTKRIEPDGPLWLSVLEATGQSV
jgi:6-phosphofructokinase 1